MQQYDRCQYYHIQPWYPYQKGIADLNGNGAPCYRCRYIGHQENLLQQWCQQGLKLRLIDRIPHATAVVPCVSAYFAYPIGEIYQTDMDLDYFLIYRDHGAIRYLHLSSEIVYGEIFSRREY